MRPDRAYHPDLPPDPPLRDLIRDLYERIDGLTARIDGFITDPPTSEPPRHGRPGWRPEAGTDCRSARSHRPGAPEVSLREAGEERALAGPHRISQDEAAPRGHSPYLDAERAADYLGVTLKSLYGIVERGHLKPLRGPRRRYRFTTAMLDEYLGRKGDAR